jgi:hypothetical protein
MRFILEIVLFVLMIGFVSAAAPVALSDQGTGVKYKSSGAVVVSADIRVEIYDAAVGGNLIYSETFVGGISNGNWNLMLGENPAIPLYLDYGKQYYRDYAIAGIDVDFRDYLNAVIERQMFFSPLGTVPGSGVFVGKTSNSYSADLGYTYTGAVTQQNITVEVVVNQTLENQTFFNATSGLNETIEVLINVTENQTVLQNVSSGNVTTSGYDAANRICFEDFKGAHLCSEFEMVGAISALNFDLLSSWDGAAWVYAGGAKYSPADTPANDCNGFTHGSAGSFLGTFWLFEKPNGGKSALGHCGNSFALACCR